jgi:hypothetical protein
LSCSLVFPDPFSCSPQPQLLCSDANVGNAVFSYCANSGDEEGSGLSIGSVAAPGCTVVTVTIVPV